MGIPSTALYMYVCWYSDSDSGGKGTVETPLQQMQLQEVDLSVCDDLQEQT